VAVIKHETHRIFFCPRNPPSLGQSPHHEPPPDERKAGGGRRPRDFEVMRIADKRRAAGRPAACSPCGVSTDARLPKSGDRETPPPWREVTGRSVSAPLLRTRIHGHPRSMGSSLRSVQLIYRSLSFRSCAPLDSRSAAALLKCCS
jgi:hypothetical protein